MIQRNLDGTATVVYPDSDEELTADVAAEAATEGETDVVRGQKILRSLRC